LGDGTDVAGKGRSRGSKLEIAAGPQQEGALLWQIAMKGSMTMIVAKWRS